MTSKESLARKMKRKAMKEAGLTFADRVTESVRTGKPISEVGYKIEGKKIVAVKQ